MNSLKLGERRTGSPHEYVMNPSPTWSNPSRMPVSMVVAVVVPHQLLIALMLWLLSISTLYVVLL